ncbi:MAG: hypothetical protein B7Z26_03840 [Asticcacaulis sp. 32-58-5]|nr:MAG: hypothetical protein B7Z26_03840 [Asticcacaulis sp. 32-58-5]
MTGLLTWSEYQRQNFTKKTLLFSHGLANSELFTDEALIELIDRYPPEKLEVFSMGYDPSNWGQWYLGRRSGLDGRALMDGVKAGRLWLNLRKVNHADPAFNELCGRMFAELEAETGQKTLKPDLGLLISSPKAHVFYHLDIPLVMLWQVRGVKKLYVYPPKAPFVTNPNLEGIALRESDEQLPYEAAWDEAAMVHDLKPGEMITWPQNAPHRIVNHDMVNVSMSIEFMTPTAIWRANVLYANGCLRRWFGLNPDIDKRFRTWEAVKIIYARAIKAFGGFNGAKSPLTPRFSLDASQPGVPQFDDGVEVPKKAA